MRKRNGKHLLMELIPAVTQLLFVGGRCSPISNSDLMVMADSLDDPRKCQTIAMSNRVAHMWATLFIVSLCHQGHSDGIQIRTRNSANLSFVDECPYLASDARIWSLTFISHLVHAVRAVPFDCLTVVTL